jgi:hypothetical protein
MLAAHVAPVTSPVAGGSENPQFLARSGLPISRSLCKKNLVLSIWGVCHGAAVLAEAVVSAP